MRRTKVERAEVSRTYINGAAIEKTEYETIDITILRRGVIGVNIIKIGICFRCRIIPHRKQMEHILEEGKCQSQKQFITASSEKPVKAHDGDGDDTL